MMIRSICQSLALVGLLLIAAPAHAQQPPDLILHHGKIVTVDSRFSIAEALAVAGGRIVAVGPSSEIIKLAGPLTTQMDLRGKTVLPGLMDSHVHAADASLYEFDHTVPDMETIDDVLHYIKARADALGPGKWISVSQVFITRL